MAEFEAAYREKVVPILKRHGLVESSERGRATPDSVFNRLFELKTPGEVAEKQKALQGDSTWAGVLWDLGKAFGISGSDNLIQFGFDLYSAPAGPGRVVPTGPGKAVPAGHGTGHWRTYDAADGLVQAIVQAIFQDREGNLWFGTRGGVSRYDGKSFTAFTTQNGLVDNRVNSIFQDREGDLWFGTWGGVSRYDGRAFTNFTTREGLPNNWVWSVFQDREGNLWFGSNGGASRYDGRSFTTFTTKDGLAHIQVQTIFQDREGNLWFGTLGGGASRYDGKSWISFTTRDGLPNNRVKPILQDREGNLWFGSNGGASRYDGRSFTTFTTKDGLINDNVISILQDQEGFFWIGTIEGVSRYDGKTFTTQEGLTGSVWSIFQDREGHIWFGAWGGVSRYDGKTFTTFTTKDGLVNNRVSSILQDREGYLWFGTRDGLSRYDGKAFETFTAQDGLAHNLVYSVFQDWQGNLWFGTVGGVSRYDGKTFTTFTTKDGLTNDWVWPILQDREGNLWFGTVGGGVSRYDGKTFTTYSAFDGLASNTVLSIFQDQEGYLWFGTEGGVSRYDPSTPGSALRSGQGRGGRRSNEPSGAGTFRNFTTRDGLVSNRVYDIHQDRDRHLWFGTWGGGVSRYDGRTFTNFTTQDGLADDWVNSIFQDREGHLWFGISGGLTRYDGKTFQKILKEDGLGSNEVHPIIQDRNEYLWFGTEKGVTRYRPSSPSPPPVFIDAVIADRRYEKISNLAIPASVKLMAFEFHGISLKTRPGGLIYRYRLKGYDKDWKNTYARRVEYPDLPRGTYTFEVQAVDRDLVYSEKPATVTLRMHLPYERIGWMSALGIAMAVIVWQAGRIVYRDRLLQASNAALSSANKDLFGLNRQLEEANARLQEVDAVKTDFFSNVSHELRTPMTAIKGYADNLLDGIAGALGERQTRYIGRIRANADRLMRLINDLLDLSRLDRGRKDLLQLNIQRLSIREAVSEAVEGLRPMAEEAGLRLTFEGEEAYGLADRDRLVQVVTNLVGNAIKFTSAGGRVRVTVGVGDQGKGEGEKGRKGEREKDSSPTLPLSHSPAQGWVVVCIRDTGRGIPAEDLGRIFDRFYQVSGSHGGTGLGLPITKELVELMGGTIHVESEVGGGSAFWFTLPTA